MKKQVGWKKVLVGTRAQMRAAAEEHYEGRGYYTQVVPVIHKDLTGFSGDYALYVRKLMTKDVAKLG